MAVSERRAHSELLDAIREHDGDSTVAVMRGHLHEFAERAEPGGNPAAPRS